MIDSKCRFCWDETLSYYMAQCRILGNGHKNFYSMDPNTNIIYHVFNNPMANKYTNAIHISRDKVIGTNWNGHKSERLVLEQCDQSQWRLQAHRKASAAIIGCTPYHTWHPFNTKNTSSCIHDLGIHDLGTLVSLFVSWYYGFNLSPWDQSSTVNWQIRLGDRLLSLKYSLIVA